MGARPQPETAAARIRAVASLAPTSMAAAAISPSWMRRGRPCSTRSTSRKTSSCTTHGGHAPERQLDQVVEAFSDTASGMARPTSTPPSDTAAAEIALADQGDLLVRGQQDVERRGREQDRHA